MLGKDGTKLTPTEEQEAIMQAVREPESLMVKAYAGTAKTTTLEMTAGKVRTSGLALAFNAGIAKELKLRFPPHFKVQTMNGLGLGAWLRSRPGMTPGEPDRRKLGKLVTGICKEQKIVLVNDQWEQTHRLVTRAMQAGVAYRDEGDFLARDNETTWTDLATELWITPEDFGVIYDLARETLRQSVALAKAGAMSFDDQVYCPVILGGQFPRYPTIMVDEAQDLNPLNHRMLQLCMTSETKLIAVGDPKQAIYAFRGASSNSMDLIGDTRSQWLDRPLTTTFRCPKIVVARQQRHAPGFKAWHSNAEGIFTRFAPVAWSPGGDASGGWEFKDLAGAKPHPGATVAVLCRNNAPLLKLAFKLIRVGVGPFMLGREIGKGLITLSRKIVPEDGESADRIRDLVEEWKSSEISKALGAGKDDQVAGITDRAECLLVVTENARDAGELRQVLERIFSREGGEVTLATIHKAKGLEWDVVLHLDPWRIPGKNAVAAEASGDPTPMQQELNLLYVCETRAKHTLLNASINDWRTK